jgi:hypothetical protein
MYTPVALGKLLISSSVSAMDWMITCSPHAGKAGLNEFRLNLLKYRQDRVYRSLPLEKGGQEGFGISLMVNWQ